MTDTCVIDRYAIDFRSYHTAIHGLYIYESREIAMEALKQLRAMEQAQTYDEASALQNLAMRKTIGSVDEINWRDIQQDMMVEYDIWYSDDLWGKECAKLTIVNEGELIDVY